MELDGGASVRRVMLGVAASAALAACVATYREAAEGAPAATLAFEKGYTVGTSLARSTLQEYWIVKDATCAAPQRAAWFTWANGEAAAKRVPAQTPILLVARTRFLSGSGALVSGQPGVRVTGAECLTLAQFTPAAGRSYRVAHRADPELGCPLIVVDAATDAPPADLVLREPLPCPDGAIP